MVVPSRLTGLPYPRAAEREYLPKLFLMSCEPQTSQILAAQTLSKFSLKLATILQLVHEALTVSGYAF